MIITSTANPRIKEFKQLHSKKHREQIGQYWMEGLRIVGEAVDKDAPLVALVICRSLLHNDFAHELISQTESKQIEIIEVSETVFYSLAEKENPQGMAAIGKVQFSTLDDLYTSTGFYIALNEIADPGNLGTIIRTADAVAADGVILLGNTTSPFDHTSVRSSMGALFSQKIAKTSFDNLITWTKIHPMQIIGTSDRASDDYTTIPYRKPLILLMGSERAGLNAEHLAACEAVARIPMMRSSDSLNLSVATGIMAYQIFNTFR